MGYRHPVLAAVHYVNAYLWERYHLAPANHDQRTHGVHHDTALSPCSFSYEVLKSRGFHARYSEGFTFAEPDARELLNNEFRAVEMTVMRALGQPVPAW